MSINAIDEVLQTNEKQINQESIEITKNEKRKRDCEQEADEPAIQKQKNDDYKSDEKPTKEPNETPKNTHANIPNEILEPKNQKRKRTPEQEEERAQEPLLHKQKNRFVIFPIRHKKIWHFVKKQEASIWSAQDIQLAKDVQQFQTLTPDEQHFIKHILSFFASSDGIVAKNLEKNFIRRVKIKEAIFFYDGQKNMENIHAETYSLLIDTLIKDPEEKERLFNGIEKLEAVKQKAEWALKWMHAGAKIAELLIAFAAVEGIFFSGSFCAIFWLKKRGLMPGLSAQNSYVSRDENLHTDFACLLYTEYIKNKLSQSRVHEIIADAVRIETFFICEALPCALIGMNANLMKQYIEYVSDRLLLTLGYEKLFKTPNPFNWMELLSLASKGNFFEIQVTEYQKDGVMNYEEAPTKKFNVNGDF